MPGAPVVSTMQAGKPGTPSHQNGHRNSAFERVAAWTIRATGGRWGFLTALGIVLAWAISGPLFHFSELWQLVINTGTTIVTFLMVFLIQNAQNRESKAVHLKLDELILAVRSANNALINIESMSDEQLEQLAERYRHLSERYHRVLETHPEVMVPANGPEADAAADQLDREDAAMAHAANGSGPQGQ